MNWATLKAAAAVTGLAAFANPATARELTLELAPIVRLSGDEVVACGVAFKGLGEGDGFSAEFVLEKAEPQPEFVLTARHQSPSHVYNMALQSEGGSTAGLLPLPRPIPDGSLETRGLIPSHVGSAFVQSLMVTGGNLLAGIAGPSGDVLDFKLPAPFPHSVRASYLACAGDLVRP